MKDNIKTFFKLLLAAEILIVSVHGIRITDLDAADAAVLQSVDTTCAATGAVNALAGE